MNEWIKMNVGSHERKDVGIDHFPQSKIMQNRLPDQAAAADRQIDGRA